MWGLSNKMNKKKIKFLLQTCMFQPVYYNMLFCYRINQHIMPCNKCSSETGVFAAFKSNKWLF